MTESLDTVTRGFFIKDGTLMFKLMRMSFLRMTGVFPVGDLEFGSRCLLAVKANGDDRFCTDYQKVNGMTNPDCFLLPRMEDCVVVWAGLGT